MKYNYVIFNYTDDYFSFNEEEDYYAICLRDLKDRDDVILNHIPLQEQSIFIKFLYLITNSRLFQNQYWRIPIKRLWFPLVFKNTFKNDKPICFVCLRYPPMDYLLYLKRKHKDCKIVKMSRDLIRTQVNQYKKYNTPKIFDLWFSYDEKDCKEYGFIQFDEFESKIEIPIRDNYPLADVFFAGRAKDRLKTILQFYDKLSSYGLRCYFYIVDAKEDEKQNRPGVIYSDKSMTYLEMLDYSVNSRCLLDINQKGAVGFTSRFLEAVMFNKQLITNNVDVKKSKFYDKCKIMVVDSPEDVKSDFIVDEGVDYKYDGEFSPLKRLELIDSCL